nr:dihydrolipoyl dehydrogenase [bacterium]
MAQKSLVVIGGGPGGYVAAIRAAQLGMAVTLVEKARVGGTCLNRGCIPTKALMHAAHVYEGLSNCAELGIDVEKLSFDEARLYARKDGVVSQLREGIESLLASGGINVLRGQAVIEAPGKTRVGQTLVESHYQLIATGGQPAVPPIPGANLPGVVTSDDLLLNAAVYKRLTIIGGGVIGVEFATLYRALGREVTVIEGLPRLLPALQDREISQNLAMIFKKRGIAVHTGATVSAIERGADGALACTFAAAGATKSVISDAVLVAVGRKPNTAGLFAGDMAVEMERGGIVVDQNLQTSQPGIYAIGDVVAGNIQLAHVASAQGVNAVSHMMGLPPAMNLAAVPSCVYTKPEIALVGLTPDAAKAQGIPAEASKFVMSANGKTVIEGGERGFVRVVYHKETGKVLGAQLMCERATDLISEMSSAIACGLTIDELSCVIRPHPTFSEGLSEALEGAHGRAIHIAPRRGR